jgi:hypothetical protein
LELKLRWFAQSEAMRDRIRAAVFRLESSDSGTWAGALNALDPAGPLRRNSPVRAMFDSWVDEREDVVSSD